MVRGEGRKYTWMAWNIFLVSALVPLNIARSAARFGLLLCCVSESQEKLDDDQDDDEVGFERTPKPMLPYSSLFIFGPTNP